MAKAMRLQVEEPVQIDTRRLAEIMRELGEAAARNLISRAVTQVGANLDQLSVAARAGDLRRISVNADRLSRDAWQIGMTTLSVVAVHAADCARGGDGPAVAAVLARLDRVAAQSLEAVTGVPKGAG